MLGEVEVRNDEAVEENKEGADERKEMEERERGWVKAYDSAS